MLKARSFLKLFLLLFIVQNSFSAIEVYTKEESQCGNLSVQRIYLKNTGTQDLQGFKFYYYFLTSPTTIPYLISLNCFKAKSP